MKMNRKHSNAAFGNGINLVFRCYLLLIRDERKGQRTIISNDSIIKIHQSREHFQISK